MTIDKPTIYRNRIVLSIILFGILISMIHYFKPRTIYNKDGSFMQLGVGYSNKTIFPFWLIVIVVSIVSYISIMLLIHYIA
jgi:uncharacterized membrane protein YidH (DUF202 family)